MGVVDGSDRVHFGTLIAVVLGDVLKSRESDYRISTYQSWNCASGKPSLGCIVTYRMPCVDLDAMMDAG
jgi:hypothetical protein